MPLLLIGNNCDQHHRRAVTFEMGKALANQHGMSFLEASGRGNYNVEEAFLQLTDDMIAMMATGTSQRKQFKLKRHRLHRVQLTWLLCRRCYARSNCGEAHLSGMIRLLQALPCWLFLKIITMLDPHMFLDEPQVVSHARRSRARAKLKLIGSEDATRCLKCSIQ